MHPLTHLGYICLSVTAGVTLFVLLAKALSALVPPARGYRPHDDVPEPPAPPAGPASSSSPEPVLPLKGMHLDPRQVPVDLKEPAMDAGQPPEPGYAAEVVDAWQASDLRKAQRHGDLEGKRQLARHIAELAERKERVNSLIAVRCPVCQSPEGVTCNPSLPEGMETLYLADYVFTHGLRVIKAVSTGKADRDAVLAQLADDDLGDEIRAGLPEPASDAA